MRTDKLQSSLVLHSTFNSTNKKIINIISNQASAIHTTHNLHKRLRSLSIDGLQKLLRDLIFRLSICHPTIHHPSIIGTSVHVLFVCKLSNWSPKVLYAMPLVSYMWHDLVLCYSKCSDCHNCAMSYALSPSKGVLLTDRHEFCNT